MPMIRYGNRIANEVRFDLTHGAAPSTCEAVFPGNSDFPPGRLFAMQVGSADWFGQVSEKLVGKNNSQGLFTRIRASDLRDELLSDIVFAQINMIDEYDGRVYSIVDNATGLIEGSADWWHQTPTYGFVPPKRIIEWLLEQRNWTVYGYSPEALDTLYDTTGDDWQNSRYNVYNLDWNTGCKIGVALEQVLSQLGLQFTTIMSLPVDPLAPINLQQMRRVYITKIGDEDYANLAWDCSYANDVEQGSALQADVDTGVYIVGDRCLVELTDQPLIPGWNELWEDFAKNPNLLTKTLTALGLNKNYDTVATFAATPGNAAYAHGGYLGPYPRHKKKFNGEAFNDMTCSEYAALVGRLYRIQGMQDWMTTDEYNCDTPVREAPICTPLLSDPARNYVVKGRKHSKKDKDVYWTASAEAIEKDSGWHVDEHDGYVMFDECQDMAVAPLDGTPLVTVTASNIYYDKPVITVVLKGPLFREFVGSAAWDGEMIPRRGSKRVTGLREAFVMDSNTFTSAGWAYNATDGWTWPTDSNGRVYPPDVADEYIRTGEKAAVTWAHEIGDTLISPYRQRLPSSGSATWKGIAGHVPSGAISRVTTSVHWQSGISETVQFANDRADIAYEPQIETRRKIAQQQAAREGEKLLSNRKREALRKLAAQVDADASKAELDVLAKMMHKAWNEHNYMVAANPTSEAWLVGEPVAVSCDVTSGAPTIVPSDDLDDNDKRVCGVNMQTCEGSSEEKVCVCTSGVYPTLVTGPVEHGDTLKYDSATWSLVKGNGPFRAQSAIEDATEHLIPVAIGGGGGAAATATLVKAVTTSAIVATSGIPADVTQWDGQTIVADDVVLVKNQVTGNGVYTVKAGAWELNEDAEMVAVKAGTVYAKTIWALTASETWSLMSQITARVAAATTAAIGTLSGLPSSASTDGVTVTAGQLLLVKDNGAANGVYIVRAGAWQRIIDASVAFSKAGTKHARTFWLVTSGTTWSGGGAYPI